MTCKDCIHYEVCCDEYELAHAENCNNFKDKSKYIELPCKVGETLYVFNKANKPQKMILEAPDIRCHCAEEDNLCVALCSDRKHNICARRLMNDGSDIGEKVFLTKSEAEQKLREVNKNDNN